MKSRAAEVMLILIAALWAAPAALADAELGRELAEQWCSACHRIDPGPPETTVDSPPAFAALARDPELSPEALRAWLWAPHPPMPDLDLTRVEIESLVAYIESLDRR